MKLTLSGEAVANWTESSGSNKTQTTFSGHESLLDASFYIFGGKNSDCDIITSGKHIVKFEYRLPSTLPYSAEGKHGHVKYSLKANLDIPWAFDLQDEKSFTIIREDKVENLIECNLPIEMEEVKTFCCWCCKSGPVTLTVRLTKSGFSTSEKILVNVQINNQSSKRVENSTLELKRIHKYFCHDPIKKLKEHKETLVDIIAKGAEIGENVNFDVEIELPESLTVSNQSICKVYQICYELKVNANTEGLSVSPEVIVPLFIGKN